MFEIAFHGCFSFRNKYIPIKRPAALSGCDATKHEELEDHNHNNGHDANADSAVIAVTSSVMEETTNECDIQVRR